MTCTRTSANKHVKVVINCEGLPCMSLYYPLIIWSYEVMQQTKSTFSTISIPMVTKLVRVKHHKELPPVNLHYPTMRWPCEIMWQITYIISPLKDDPWTLKQTRCLLINKAPTLKAIWSFDYMNNGTSYDNLKNYIFLLYSRSLNLTWELSLFRRFSMQTLKLSPISCFSLALC